MQSDRFLSKKRDLVTFVENPNLLYITIFETYKIFQIYYLWLYCLIKEAKLCFNLLSDDR